MLALDIVYINIYLAVHSSAVEIETENEFIIGPMCVKHNINE